MKQQFLNDSGLTELIGYIKKYVKDEQDVKPYASLSVFPKTGEQNIIYIDTTVNASYYWDDTSKTYKALDVQTWATLNGKPTTFPPEDHNHDDRYFTETEMNSKLAGKADSSHTHKKADITDFPTSMPASDVPAWAKASTKPTYTKAEVGLGNVDNTADKDKSVKYATSAGSAGTASSVDWSGVKNPPTTYAPSSHTHDDRYYTESEINSKLDGKSNTGHTHDDRYYTESEMNTKLAGKSDTSHSHNLSTMINTLVEGTSAPTDDDYYIAQYAGGGTTNTTYTRRLHSALWSYIKGKADSAYQVKGSYAASSHTHTIAQISNLQTILDSKASASHTHTIANVTGLQSALDGKAASSHTHSYLPLSGGTMNGTAFISWPDTGNWSNNNSGVKFPVNRGGLQWNGQSDGVSLYAVETANDNLELYLRFIDDDSNGLSIINSVGNQTARITSSGAISGTSFTGPLYGNASTATALTTSAGSASQPVYFSGGKPVACSYTLGKSVPSNAVFTDTNTWRPLGTTADTACAGNDSRLSNARPASDVYDWAKASSKPSYSWSEIGSKPSTFTPSSHSHSSLTTVGDLRSTATTPNSYSNSLIFQGLKNNSTIGVSDAGSYSYVIGLRGWSDSSGGKAHELAFNDDSGIYTRMGSTTSWEGWRKLLDSSNYTSYTVTKSGSGASGTWGINVTGSAGSVAWGNVSGRPSSLPASDVYAWAKASSKPSYSWSEISNKPSSMPASDVYSWAKASSKPGYSWGEISGKPSTFTPSSHTHNYAGSSSAGGSANWANGASYANYAIKTACNPTEDKSTNGLFMFQYSENTTICPDSAWWSVVRTQHSGYNNGYWQEMAYRFDSDIIKFRRNVNGSKSAWKTIAFTDSKVSSAGYADSAGSANSVAWGNVSGKPSTYTPSSHSHNYAGSGSAGGSANSAVKLDTDKAGGVTQPVYFTGGKPVACSYTLGKSVPSNAVFTDTNTWRGIQNNLTSTSTSDSLSAYQGKVLNDNKIATSNIVNNLTSTSSTVPLSANMGRELNTKIKAAKFFAGGKFYVPSNGGYSGLAIGTTAYNDAQSNIKYVDASSSDYKHYYTFSKGIYLVNISLFFTINGDASTSNVLGTALSVEVDDVQVANPWFRQINVWQTVNYSMVVHGSKLKVTMYVDRLVEIQSDTTKSYIEIVRLNY